ncbi:MAG TPA: hypothetical protein VKQ32_14735 [Polyangia bacterium]|nr:hypothetical protein [Polyangia bacterium]
MDTKVLDRRFGFKLGKMAGRNTPSGHLSDRWKSLRRDGGRARFVVVTQRERS